MPDQPKFCVVPCAPTEAMMKAANDTDGVKACNGMLAIADMHGASLPLDCRGNNTIIHQAWRAMISSRGREAEAHVAVPKSKLDEARDLVAAFDAAGKVTLVGLANYGDLALELLRALLNPAKE